MAKDLNLVTLIGRLVRNPEILYTKNGTPCCKFSIAVSDGKGKMQIEEHVNFFDVVVWGNAGINCEKYLKKGSQANVTGSLKQDRWKDQSTGQTKTKIHINASSVQFLAHSNQNQQQAPQQPQQNYHQ